MVQSAFLISYLIHFPWLLWLCFLTIKPECFNCTLPHCWKNISQLFSFNSLNLDAPHLAGLKIIKISSPFYTLILSSNFHMHSSIDIDWFIEATESTDFSTYVLFNEHTRDSRQFQVMSFPDPRAEMTLSKWPVRLSCSFLLLILFDSHHHWTKLHCQCSFV